MSHWQMAITVICAIIASSGFWAFLTGIRSRKDHTKHLLLGLAHDRIVYLGMIYIDRGWISEDEYKNLVDYLYKPYADMGGNGVAKKIIEAVGQLEMKHIQFGRDVKPEDAMKTANYSKKEIDLNEIQK